MDDAPKTLLVTLTGKDRPGVTSAMFAALAAAGVEVVDIEQIVLRRRLVLGILVTAPRDWKRLRDVIERTASDLDMVVEVDRGAGDNRSRRGERSHITIIGNPLKASAMSAIAGRIADSGANIDKIERMARYPVTAIELHVSGAPAETLRPLLSVEAVKQGIDLAVQRDSLHRRGIRLIVMDVDSTLIQGEVIEMLAAHAGQEVEVVDGRLTGRIVGDVVDRAGKAAALREFAGEVGVPLDAVIAIGDGANDLDMLNAAGLGIAYNAKPMVRAAADTAVNVPYLDAILYLLGISREQIEEADAAVGITTPAPPLIG